MHCSSRSIPHPASVRSNSRRWHVLSGRGSDSVIRRRLVRMYCSVAKRSAALPDRRDPSFS
jgi:hypothetical protein